MPEDFANEYSMHTHTCGELRRKDIGQTVTLTGWVARRRDHGGLIFVDLRDRTGITQVVFDPDTAKDCFELGERMRPEWAIEVTGFVRERPEDTANPDLPTGEIDVVVNECTILNESATPPFPLDDDIDTDELTRMKWRYLDMRRTPVADALRLRDTVTWSIRNALHERLFIEVETPILGKSTPEGARDFIVPSRTNPGHFYALPQSPQLFKQLTQIGGIERYYQVARCFRDEDLRADRQPEFTQVDIEMSFVTEDDVMNMMEDVLAEVFKAVGIDDVSFPLDRVPYAEAMARYGTDRPDRRFGMELVDISDIVKDCGFKVFSGPVAAGGSVRLINIEGGAAAFPRKKIDKLGEFVKTYKAKGLAWARLLDGKVTSSYQKFLTEEENAAILARAGAKDGDLVLIVGDTKDEVVFAALGALRLECAKQLDILDPKEFRFLWVTEFPMFEWSEEEGRYQAMHHPFTAPMLEDEDKMLTDKANCRARAYDIVLNGTELGGGSIRINTPEMQTKAFEALGISDEDIQERFGHLVNAFQYGAPPHGGLAYGLDRLVMLMTGASSIRDVIAFPKVQNASDLMMNCPDVVDEKQLDDLSIAVTRVEEEPAEEE